MQYALTGFTHNAGFRIFAFEGTGADRVKKPFSVKADMSLARKYGIRVQELPLLCKEVLEKPHDEAEQAFTYLECDMSIRAAEVAAAGAQKKKGPRSPRPVVSPRSQISLLR